MDEQTVAALQKKIKKGISSNFSFAIETVGDPTQIGPDAGGGSAVPC